MCISHTHPPLQPWPTTQARTRTYTRMHARTHTATIYAHTHRRMRLQGVWEAFNGWSSAVAIARQDSERAKLEAQVARANQERDTADMERADLQRQVDELHAMLGKSEDDKACVDKELQEVLKREAELISSLKQFKSDVEYWKAKYDDAAGDSAMLRGEVSHSVTFVCASNACRDTFARRIS
jgi:chromosome segregation ATPase